MRGVSRRSWVKAGWQWFEGERQLSIILTCAMQLCNVQWKYRGEIDVRSSRRCRYREETLHDQTCRVGGG